MIEEICRCSLGLKINFKITTVYLIFCLKVMYSLRGKMYALRGKLICCRTVNFQTMFLIRKLISVKLAIQQYVILHVSRQKSLHQKGTEGEVFLIQTFLNGIFQIVWCDLCPNRLTINQKSNHISTPRSPWKNYWHTHSFIYW